VEQLEARQLMAGHITLNAALGVVNVQGSPGRDRVQVSYTRGAGDVRVIMTGGAHGQATFARNAVREVVVRGNHEQVVNRTDLPVERVAGSSSKAGGVHRAASGLNADGLTAGEKLVLQQTNATRASRGLPPLVINPVLQRAAEARAHAEANSNTYYGDSGFPGNITATGYSGSIMGQNDAYCYGYSNPAQQLMNQWLASPPHLANIVYGGYVEVGIAVVTGPSGNTFGVQTFGAP
jgi:uncharacterized protein YkwD